MIARLFFAILFIATLLTSPAQAQFADQATWGGTGGGTANAQTVTIPNVSALADLTGVEVRFSPGATNSGATTLAASGLVATAMRKWSPAGLIALTGGELTTGTPVSVMYNGTFFILLSPTATQPLPTRQVFTSGSGTYTTGVSGGQTARHIIVRYIGGGGGGGAINTNTGAAGTASSFNSITAAGGSGGPISATQAGGAGGTGGSGSASLRIAGGDGGTGQQSAVASVAGNGGHGGSGAFGGGARTGTSGQAGQPGKANSGGGGGGAAGGGATTGAGGGGSGEYVELVITSPAGSYSYAVGAGGTGGAAGAVAGGDGGSGIIIVDEFYLRCMHLLNELMPANDNEEWNRCAA